MSEESKEKGNLQEGFQEPFYLEPIGQPENGRLGNRIWVQREGPWIYNVNQYYNLLQGSGVIGVGLRLLEKYGKNLDFFQRYFEGVSQLMMSRRSFLKNVSLALLGLAAAPTGVEVLKKFPKLYWQISVWEQNPYGCALIQFVNADSGCLYKKRLESERPYHLGGVFEKTNYEAGTLYEMPVIWPKGEGVDKDYFKKMGNKVFVFVGDSGYKPEVRLASEEEPDLVTIAPTQVGFLNPEVGAVAHFSACAPQAISLSSRVRKVKGNDNPALSIVYGSSSLAVTGKTADNPLVWQHAESRLYNPPDIFPELEPFESPFKMGLLMMKDGKMELVRLSEIKKIVESKKLPDGASGLFLNQFGFSGETLKNLESLDISFGKSYHRSLNLIGQLNDGRVIFIFGSWHLTLTNNEYPKIIRKALENAGISLNDVVGLWCMDLGLATGLRIKDGNEFVSPAHGDRLTIDNPGGKYGFEHTNAGVFCLTRK